MILNNKVLIVPTILVANKAEVVVKLKQLQGVVKRVQLDIADGRFAPVKTVELQELQGEALLTTFELEAHLMVKEPIGWLSQCKQLGVKIAVGHIERMSSQQRFVEEARDLGMAAGLGLNLETDIEEVESGLLSTVKEIVLLANKPGYGGQSFDHQVLEKIERVRYLTGGVAEICVDIGINEQTAPLAVKAGANVLAVGSFLWQDNPKVQIDKLKEAINEI
ncbi:hypothetical protein KKD62_03105 [Patescibacteria group bacterium]|nr:hypothetical protein [Patescibacteria group bacterium]MBU1931548.1 hypothetical protein [Patescibacteria group bacterium]